MDNSNLRAKRKKPPLGGSLIGVNALKEMELEKHRGRNTDQGETYQLRESICEVREKR